MRVSLYFIETWYGFKTIELETSLISSISLLPSPFACALYQAFELSFQL